MRSDPSLLHVDVQFAQHCWFKGLSFLQCMFLGPLSRIRGLVSAEEGSPWQPLCCHGNLGGHCGGSDPTHQHLLCCNPGGEGPWRGPILLLPQWRRTSRESPGTRGYVSDTSGSPQSRQGGQVRRSGMEVQTNSDRNQQVTEASGGWQPARGEPRTRVW